MSRLTWRSWIPVLFWYLSFEGLFRRLFPALNLEIFVTKDILIPILFFYCFIKFPRELHTFINGIGMHNACAAFAFITLVLCQCLNPSIPGLPTAAVGLRGYIWYLPTIFVGYVYADSLDRVKALLRHLTWMVIPVFIYGLYQVATGHFTPMGVTGTRFSEDLWIQQGAGGLRNNVDGRLIPTIASTLFGGRLAVFGLFWAVITIWLAVTPARGRGPRWHYPLVIVSAFGCILLGTNRTAFALAIAATAATLWYTRATMKFIARYFVLGAVVALVIAIMPFGTRVSETAQRTAAKYVLFLSGLVTTDAADTHGSRYSVVGYEVVSGIIQAAEETGHLGIGTGALSPGTQYLGASGGTISNVMSHRWAKSDSQWVRITGELGVVGLIVYVVWIIGCIATCLRTAARYRTRDPSVGTLNWLGALMLFVYLVLGYKHGGFAADPFTQIYVFLIFGAAIRCVRQSTQRSMALYRPAPLP